MTAVSKDLEVCWVVLMKSVREEIKNRNKNKCCCLKIPFCLLVMWPWVRIKENRLEEHENRAFGIKNAIERAVSLTIYSFVQVWMLRPLL